MSRFSKATREKIRLRLALDGPAGSGKTYTALSFAFHLARHYGGQVGVIDTEAESASKYVGYQPDGSSMPWEFHNTNLTNFAPTEYTSAIEEAGREGFTVLVIDSLSHAWEGKDGALEQVDRKGGNRFTGWKDVTPQHRRMVEAILASKCHIIATMRSKTDYVLEENEKGKSVPRRVGMAPIQRQGMEYEFDVYGSMDWSHMLTISKSRCPSIDQAIAVKPSGNFLDPVIRWLDTGEVSRAPTGYALATKEQMEAIIRFAAAMTIPLEKLKKDVVKKYAVAELADLTHEQARELEARLQAQAEAAAKRKRPTTDPVTGSATKPPAAAADAQPSQARPDTYHPPATPTETIARATSTNGSTDAAVQPPLPIDGEQFHKLGQLRQQLFEHLGITANAPKCHDVWRGILGKRGVDSAKQLTYRQAEELISNLLEKLPAQPNPFDQTGTASQPAASAPTT